MWIQSIFTYMLDADDDDEVVVDEACTSLLIMLKNTFSPFCKFLGNVVFLYFSFCFRKVKEEVGYITWRSWLNIFECMTHFVLKLSDLQKVNKCFLKIFFKFVHTKYQNYIEILYESKENQQIWRAVCYDDVFFCLR